MHTQVEQAKRGTITPQVQEIARSEGIDPGTLCENIAAGNAVIMRREIELLAGLEKVF